MARAEPEMITAQAPQADNLPPQMANPDGTAPGLYIEQLMGKSLINLRADKGLKARLIPAFGTDLPCLANRMHSVGSRRALWLGPDETLLIADEGDEAALLSALAGALGRNHYAATIVSDAYCVLRLQGGQLRWVLAKGCSVDLHDSVFTAGHCAQSQLAHAAVILAAEPDGVSFLLVCRTSFADYVISWLKDAAIECGYQTSCQRQL